MSSAAEIKGYENVLKDSMETILCIHVSANGGINLIHCCVVQIFGLFSVNLWKYFGLFQFLWVFWKWAFKFKFTLFGDPNYIHVFEDMIYIFIYWFIYSKIN